MKRPLCKQFMTCPKLSKIQQDEPDSIKTIEKMNAACEKCRDYEKGYFERGGKEN